MPTGAMTLACLLSLIAAQPGNGQGTGELPFNAREMELPISILPERQGEIQALELYYSQDRGKEWKLAGTASPLQKNFSFTAAADGPYWFTVLAIDKQDRKEPENPYVAPIAQKLLIDTLKPDVLHLSAKRSTAESDVIEVAWEVDEEHPMLESLQVEYRTGSSSWRSVDVAAKMKGTAKLRVGPDAGSVRVRMQDTARNLGEAEARFTTVSTVVAKQDSTDVVPPPPGAFEPLPSPIPGSADVRRAASNDAGDVPKIETDTHPRGHVATVGPKAIASSSNGHETAAAAERRAPESWGHPGTIPVISNPKVTLEYEVAELGPSGVGDVELYVTRDDGRTWQRFPSIKHLGPQRNDGARKPAAAVRRMIAAELKEEGLYGFYLVVKSGAGLGKPAPSSGDAPHMRLELDTTAPVAAMYPLELHPQQSNVLVLRWRASDKNLADKPIALHWSAQPSGPWQAMSEDALSSSGSYDWTVPASVPARVYLRLTVRDRAGNTAVAQTPEPVLVDLHKPEVKSLKLVGSHSSLP